MPQLATLDQLVASFAERGATPALVVFSADATVTHSYADLAAAIAATAGGLRARGLGPDDLLLLWAPNSAAWIAAYFGALACGATVIPLDAQTHAERATAVLLHSRAKIAVTTQEHAAELARAGFAATACVLVDGDPADPRHVSHLRATVGTPPTPDPERIASLLYTSGTTGNPKAVPLTHANLAANVAGLLGARLVTAEDVVLVPLPFHHVYPFTVGLLTVLAAGARVVLPAGITGPEITRASSESGATALITVPRLCAAVWDGIERGVRARGKNAERLFHTLLAICGFLRRWTGLAIGRWAFRALHARIGPRLRTVGCGGAQLDAPLARHLEALGYTVLTGYGLTETSPVLTFNQHRHRRLGTEGLPLPGVEIRFESHPDYEHGEIVARGPNVFGGYWNNPEATREAFTNDGWFRTGDLGWLDRSGYLHIAGRSKEVIVLPDGKNVFPDEIEDELGASRLIAEIAVLEQDGRLCGLVVPDDRAVRERGAHRIEELLKEEIADRSAKLPPYQRLSNYRLTRTPLPRTPLGKLRRHLLPAAYAEAATRKAPTAPATLTSSDQELLAGSPVRDVWAWLNKRYPDRTLTLETSPQLDLNIDSLEWVTLTLELEREFGVFLDGEAISRIVTVRDLLTEVRSAPERARADGAGRRHREIEVPGPLLRALGAFVLGCNRLYVRFMFSLETEGLDGLPPPDRAFVIAPNHTSYLDALAVAAALPRRYLYNTYWAGWVGKMHANPLMRLLSRATRVFPVEPDRDAGGAVALGVQALERKHILVWFPEGARSHDGRLQRFQSGLGLVLGNPDACAVPTAILGAFEAWPRDRRYPRRAPVRVVFGRALRRDELAAMGEGASDAERVADGLRSAVAALLAKSAR